MLFFSGTALVCAAYYTFFTRFPPGLFELYALALVGSAFLAVAWVQRLGGARNSASHDRRGALQSAVVFFGALSLGLYHLGSYPIWLDEEMQANVAQSLMASIVRGAAFSQTPLSYYFTALNLSLAGQNEYGLRVFPCVFFAASAWLFWSLLRESRIPRCERWVVTATYILNPWLIRYAQEGRPYTFALFCGMLWAHALLRFLRGPARRLGRHWLILFACTLLFFLSIGFQPPILVAACAAASLLLPASRRRFERSLLLLASALAALALLTPILFLMHFYSVQFFKPSVQPGVLRLTAQDLGSLLGHAHALMGWQLGIFLFLAGAALVPAPRGAGMKYRALTRAYWLTLLSALLFAAFFWASFTLLINYLIYTRYFLVIYPLLLLGIGLGLRRFFLLAENTRLPKRGLSALRLVTGLLLVGPEARQLPQVYHSYEYDRWNSDAKVTFDLLKRYGAPGDLAYMIPLQDPKIWEQVGFLGVEFYYRENFPVRVLSEWATDAAGAYVVSPDTSAATLIQADLNRANPRSVFLVFAEHADFSLLQSQFAHDPDILIFPAHKTLVLRLSVKKSVAATLEKFFDKVVRAAAAKEKTYRAYDILLTLAESNRDAPKCSSYLTALRGIPDDSGAIASILKRHAPKCEQI